MPRPTRPLGGNTIIVVRAPLITDPRDNSLYRDWAHATLFTIKNVMAEPFPLAEKLNFEDNRDREFSRTACRFYMPADTDILYTDRIRHENNDYDVFGHPGRWFDLDGKGNHIAVIGRVRSG